MSDIRRSLRSWLPSVFLSGVLLLAGCGAGPERSSGDPAAEADGIANAFAALPELMSSGEVTGLSMAVVQAGEPVRTFAGGQRHAETGDPIREDTIFEAASLSKPVFGYAVLRLAERGVLDLDVPLAEYLPYERLEHDSRYHAITARHVLSHQTGLPNWGGTPLEMIAAPGERFGYSGEGFVYLQKVAETLTGQNLDELVSEEVFTPLGMSESSFVWRGEFADRIATGHGGNGRPVDKERDANDSANAAASLLTTARDYAQFLAAVMAEGAPSMFERQVEVRHRSGEVAEGVFWSLGWGLQAGRLGEAFFHWGDNTGYKAYTLGYPQNGFAVIYFTNSDNGLSIVEDALAGLVDDEHPAIAWIDYERHDAPQRKTRRSLEKALRSGGSEAGEKLYREIRAQNPDLELEDMLNSLGYDLLGDGVVAEAITAFSWNADAHPESWNVHDSLGEAYLTAGDHTAAIASYERSLELNPDNTNGEKCLRFIREGMAARAAAPELEAVALRALAGNYGPFDISFRDGHLYAEVMGYDDAFAMIPLSAETFELEGFGAYRLRFHSANGEIVKVVAHHAGGREIEAQRQP